ncbi:ABC transporter ATP-binding protein [Clostridium intestinale]|uniref:ABC transporter-like protein n=1 Tax=Clostridium intestinale URNW TaxID=1294142 RepID=U2NI52_9CLOT|nr:ABC transporter ATP-binding protein [Clostridium intestinale]ERK28828.1 ABC transporter-like protein [Clostridium intestinale URNW]
MGEKNKKIDEIPSINISGRRTTKGMDRFTPKAKPKNFKKTLKRLFGYISSEKRSLVFIFSLIIIDSFIGLMAPYLIGKAVDYMADFQGTKNSSGLIIVIFVLLISYIVSGGINIVEGRIMAKISQGIVRKLRVNLFSKLHKLPISFFDTHSHGEVMSRLTNDIENVSSTVSSSTTQLMSGVITIAGSFIMMLILSPILTLASLITVPLVGGLTKIIASKTKVLFKEQQVELGNLNGYIEETISGIDIVKAFNREKEAMNSFRGINDRLCEVGLKAQIWSGFLMPIMNVINNIGFMAVASVGGIFAVKEIITVGLIASFLSYSRQFSRPLNDLASIFNNLQSAVAGAERVFEILDENEESVDREESKKITNPKGEVVFENVSFGYSKDISVLKNISFSAKEGSSTALVGATGAGKTTIISLLTRFYEVTDGSILIDGEDIRKYTRDSLRNIFGIVLQDTYLFSESIKDNIRYGNPKATDEEIEKAAKLACADSFIKRLPEGYETKIVEGGSNLSQGQRQLITIARAMLSKPSILILDEATSSVDTRTEKQVQKGMLNIMKGRTSFIIAHRLSTIRDADNILVVGNGEILESGNHYELLDKKGVYYNMYFSQFNNETNDI